MPEKMVVKTSQWELGSDENPIVFQFTLWDKMAKKMMRKHRERIKSGRWSLVKIPFCVEIPAGLVRQGGDYRS